jgi:hypothetical protein
MVLKSPYIEDTFQVDTSDVLNEVDQVIREQADKSLIYPSRWNGEVDTDQAKLYHGGSQVANYWMSFVQLSSSPDEDEKLFEMAAGAHSELEEIDSSTDLQEVDEKVDQGEIPDGNVKIKVNDDIELRVSVSRVGTDDIMFAEAGNSEFVILRGDTIEFEVTQENTREDPFPNLDSFKPLEEVIADYIN